jgi:hypothetical protein
MNIREGPVGTWSMIGPLDKRYATIDFVRRGTELGYRVTNADDAVIGYYRTLMSAAKAAHSWFTSTRGPTGMPYVGWIGAEQR